MNLERYNQHLNSIADKVSRLNVNRLSSELRNIDRMNVPMDEKAMIKGTIYGKLSDTKRRKMVNHFGETSPQTQAAMSQAATQAATQAAVTQAAISQAAMTQAITQAAMSQAITQADPSIPGFVSGVPVASMPALPPASMPVASAPMSSMAGNIVTSNYNSSAGQIQSANTALATAAQALQEAGQALAQNNISGFGRHNIRHHNIRHHNFGQRGWY